MEIASARSPLGIGAVIALAVFGIAGILGIVAVIDTDQVAAAFGTGFGIAFAVFLSGATVVCALACLARRRAELVSLASIVVTGIALDLLVFGVWRDVDSEAYTKVVGIGLVWSFFALVALGLTLAVDRPGGLARWVYLGAVASTVGAGLISTYLIATAGGDEATAENFGDSGSVELFGVTPGDDELLRALGVAFILIAALWFGAVAAHRLQPAKLADA